MKLKVVDGNCLLELWYRVNSICGAILNQRDTMLLLLAIATTISSVWLLRKNKKRGYSSERKDHIFIRTGKQKKPKKKILGLLFKRGEGIEESYTYLNLVLVVSVFGGTKTTEKATHSEEEGLDDGNVCGDG